MTESGLIPQNESDYILGKRDDIDISAVKADGKWKLCADENEPDDRDEDNNKDFIEVMKSLFEIL